MSLPKTWELAELSDQKLLEFCHSPVNKKDIIAEDGGRLVIRISESTVVKYGSGVTLAEAMTQEFARRSADITIIHIPQVYRFVTSGATWSSEERGYIFMEYVPGQSMDNVDLSIHPRLVSRIASAIGHLSQIQGENVPGSIGGRHLNAFMFGDFSPETRFFSIQDMNGYMNRALAAEGESVDMTSYPLVLCHMDLALRNMILHEDNFTISLIDWEYAGFYPRCFEVSMISWTIPGDGYFVPRFLEELNALAPLTDEETRLIRCIARVRDLSRRELMCAEKFRGKLGQLRQC
ncbi:hypothetical protein N7462_004092 [Penicillium macrosclerotiorum]|uniref:uncharacterized protein n=1 Tax=Penicillium macrosclerotiorum TaxID=303699 RepID=UPI002547D734|nr:uncharacterized protein N7462_004092 [Penicillium macrosclerotiorum]KAJ5689700.1 hypothetical protein N7462_004092 [Penicillium macrosclerotiorum]